MNADRQAHPDVDARDDEQNQSKYGGQPDEDADDQDRAEPGAAEAVALLDSGVLPGHFGSDRPG